MQRCNGSFNFRNTGLFSTWKTTECLPDGFKWGVIYTPKTGGRGVSEAIGKLVCAVDGEPLHTWVTLHGWRCLSAFT
jgi:hypothetical protein